MSTMDPNMIKGLTIALGTIVPALSLGLIGSNVMKAIGRNPEVANKILPILSNSVTTRVLTAAARRLSARNSPTARSSSSCWRKMPTAVSCVLTCRIKASA